MNPKKIELQKLKMDYPELIRLRDEIFRDFTFDVRNRIGIGVNKENRWIHCNVIAGDIYAEGLAKCSPQDEWDERTGLLLALTRMRINLLAKIKKAKEKKNGSNEKKVWIPKIGETYYFPFVMPGVYNRDKSVMAIKQTWREDNVDLIRLSIGNVYKTEREAIKAGKRMLFDGRRLIKEVRYAES